MADGRAMVAGPQCHATTSPVMGLPMHGGIPRRPSAGAPATSFASSSPSSSWELELSVTIAYLESRQMLLCHADLDYGLDSVLGRGSMGIIFKGTLERSGSAVRPVAVKRMLSPEDEKQFTMEQMMQDVIRSMNIGARIGAHPNVLDFIGAAESTYASPILVYEFINGITMDQHFQVQQTHKKKDWKPKTKQALNWGQQVFMALDWLHTSTEPIVHRDVKPSNLMLCGTDYDHVKLIDFGLARQVAKPIEDVQHKATSHISRDQADASIASNSVGGGGYDAEARHETYSLQSQLGEMTGKTGTYRYMAPEVWNEQDYGCKADVYSATMVLYFLITGKIMCVNGLRPCLRAVKDQGLHTLLNAGWHAQPQLRASARHMQDDLQCHIMMLEQTRSRSPLNFKLGLKGSFKDLRKALQLTSKPMTSAFKGSLRNSKSQDDLDDWRNDSRNSFTLSPRPTTRTLTRSHSETLLEAAAARRCSLELYSRAGSNAGSSAASLTRNNSEDNLAIYDTRELARATAS